MKVQLNKLESFKKHKYCWYDNDNDDDDGHTQSKWVGELMTMIIVRVALILILNSPQRLRLWLRLCLSCSHKSKCTLTLSNSQCLATQALRDTHVLGNRHKCLCVCVCDRVCLFIMLLSTLFALLYFRFRCQTMHFCILYKGLRASQSYKRANCTLLLSLSLATTFLRG